jgi:hypothetical protein
MKGIKKFSKLFVEVDGKFVRSDGFVEDPLNSKRTVNTTKLTSEIFEAKNFYFFQEDIPAIMKAFPNAKLFIYNFEMVYDKQEKK